MPRLSLALLGPLHITLDGRPVSGFGYNKVRALLAYLAMEAGHAHPREAVVGLLWPDQPDQAARTNLRQALATLRAALGDDKASPPFLLATRETVQFNPESDFDLDVSRFQAYLDECRAHPHRGPDRCPACAARLEQASALYRGDFLAQFALTDSAPFEEWAMLKREPLRRAAQDAFGWLAAYHERRGHDALAEQYARRQIELDPWREDAYRQLMRVLARSGQRSAALAAYEACRRALDEGLGAAPSTETRRLVEQISAEQPGPPPAPLLNWPSVATPLIGREAELAHAVEVLSDPACRLLTLVGPGGVGKTRLALAAAADQAWAYAHGAAFVSLAALSSAAYLTSDVAQALGLTLSGLSDPREQLIAALREREVLIVLDNFEHLAGPEAAEWLSTLLARAPEVHVLVTSRERLNLQGEYLLDVAGLPVPEAEAAPAEADSAGAVQLFMRCARRAQPGFALTGVNRPGIVRICRLVGGMPLALELAAPWVRTLSCDEIADEIEHGIGFLATAGHDVFERHRSVRALFDHSWRLLTGDEQRAFRGLAVFRGGFGREAAEAVASVTLPLLSALADKSLVQPSGDRRYDLHPLSRQYAHGRLREAGEEPAALARHAAHYLAFAEAADAALRGPEQPAWLSRLDAEHDNLRAALEWTLAGAPGDFVRLCGALWRYWHMRGHLREGQEWLASALACQAPAAARARALRGASALAWQVGDFGAARTLAAESASLWRTLGDARGLAQALTALGMAAVHPGEQASAAAALEESVALSRACGDDWTLALALFSLADSETVLRPSGATRALLEESLALFRRAGDRWGMALPLHGLGFAAYQQRDYATARRWLEEALALRRAIGDRWLTAQTLNILGEVARCGGDYQRAEACYQECLALYRALDAPGRVAMALHNLGYSAHWRGRTARARANFIESLRVYQRLGDDWGVAACLEGLAIVQPEAERAARLHGAAEAQREAIHAHLTPADQIEHDRSLAALRARLDAASLEAAWAAGRALNLDEAVALAVG